MTAGLVAYFSTLNGGSGSRARQTLYDNSWARVRNTKPAIYNGIANNGYASGTCSIDVLQYDHLQFEAEPSDRYVAYVTLYGDDGRIIGRGDGIATETNPLNVFSALPWVMVLKAEEQNDYVAFNYESQSWPSNGDFGPDDTHNLCQESGWRMSDWYPSPPLKTIHCSFSC